jgi:hypothetical protein
VGGQLRPVVDCASPHRTLIAFFVCLGLLIEEFLVLLTTVTASPDAAHTKAYEKRGCSWLIGPNSSM